MLIIFIVGYAFIAFEHNIKIDKAASALITGSLCWAIFALGLFEIDINSNNFENFLKYFQSKEINYTSDFINQNISYVKKKFVLYELSHHLFITPYLLTSNYVKEIEFEYLSNILNIIE